jgi:hypothetical protein
MLVNIADTLIEALLDASHYPCIARQIRRAGRIIDALFEGSRHANVNRCARI